MGAIERLGAAIGYPDPLKGPSATLQVDGGDVRVREEGGRLVLERTICAPEDGSETLARMAGFAAGRMLKEEATLAWDPARGEVVLWQDVPANAADGVLKRVFEVFCTSCDWWLARADETDRAPQTFPAMMIMP